jgi:hypothetical protein
MDKRGILVWVTVGVRPYRAGNDGRVAVGRRLSGSGDGRGKGRQAEASGGRLRLLGGRPADVALLVEGPRREVGQDAAAGGRGRTGAGVWGTFSWLAGDCRVTNGGPGSGELPQVHYKRARRGAFAGGGAARPCWRSRRWTLWRRGPMRWRDGTTGLTAAQDRAWDRLPSAICHQLPRLRPRHRALAMSLNTSG